MQLYSEPDPEISKPGESAVPGSDGFVYRGTEDCI